jgi:hypothetical protein
MKKRNYIGVLIIILCLGCQNKKEEANKNFPKEKQLESIKIPINRVFDIIDMDIADSSVIFLSNKTDTLFHIFSLPEFSFVKSFGIRGEGPDEFILPSIVSNNLGYLYVYGSSDLNVLKKLSIHAIEDAVLILDEYNLSDIPFGYSRNLSIINDSILYYMEELPMQMKMISCNLKTGEPIYSKELKVTENHKSHFDYTNNGFMAVNENTVAYAYLYQNRIDFMNPDFSLKNTLRGEQTEIEINRNGLDNSLFYYVGGYIGREKFYFRYLGSKLNERESQEKGSVIEVYDKEGNPLVKYRLDFDIYGFVVDEGNDKIYAVSEDDEDAVLVYDIADCFLSLKARELKRRRRCCLGV